MTRTSRLTLLLVLLWTSWSDVVCSPCSPENRRSDLAACLSTIDSDSKNNTLFWFGTSYAARCPNPWASTDCFNSRPYTADSLLSRIFGLGFAQQNDSLTTFLNVTFNSGTGSYSGCGNRWIVTENRYIDLDPTQSNVYKPWSVRNRPTMTWSANQNELYTMFVIDAGNFINHGIYLNIPGNDISKSEAFKEYHGPLKTSPTPNVYAFFLFKQSGRIQLSEEWRKKLGNSMFSSLYNMSSAMEYLNLTGPVGLNWMSVTMDAYAMQQMIDRRVLYTCPYLISQAVAHHNRSFIPEGTAMTVNVDVTFSPSAITFTSCCTLYAKSSRTFQLNPLGVPAADSWDVRSDANPVLDFSALGFYTEIKNFTGKTFAVLCVDPDVPRPTAGTRDRPLLHWMLVNIPEGRVAEGDTVMSYRGPRPPDAAHYYYFLLYEQTNVIDTNQTANYTTPPGSRFLFNVSDFVSDQSLTLVGVSWFTAKPDEFTRYQSETSGGNVTSLCAGQPNFATPCPVSGSAQWRQTAYQMMVTVCGVLFIKMIITHLF